MSTQRSGGPRRQSGGRGTLGCVTVLVVLGILLAIAITHNHSSDSSVPSPANPTSSMSDALPSPSLSPITADDAIEAGDCLSVDGNVPTDSTASVPVSNITKVDCSATSAQYKVVGVEPLSTDMNSCATDYPRSTVSLLDQGQYFSEVYCAVDNG